MGVKGWMSDTWRRGEVFRETGVRGDGGRGSVRQRDTGGSFSELSLLNFLFCPGWTFSWLLPPGKYNVYQKNYNFRYLLVILYRNRKAQLLKSSG